MPLVHALPAVTVFIQVIRMHLVNIRFDTETLRYQATDSPVKLESRFNSDENCVCSELDFSTSFNN